MFFATKNFGNSMEMYYYIDVISDFENFTISSRKLPL